MPLPFLKPKAVAGLIIQKRAADGSAPETGPEDEQDQGLTSAAEDLIRAVHAKDAQGVAAAFKAAFDMLESAPHEEAEQEAPETGEQG